MGLLVASAFASYFAVQSITEGNVREALLEQQKARQIEMIEHVSDQIATDVSATVAILELLAGQPSLQRAEFTSAETTTLLEHTHTKLSEINVISTVAILDEDNIIRNNSVEEARRLVGLDRSNQEYVTETRKRMQPYISPAFTSALGENIMALAVPIVHEVTGEYLGLVTTSFPTSAFFESYGGFETSRVVAFDRNQVYVATTIPEFLGEHYWGDRVQTATRANPQLNAAYTTLFSGKPASTLFISAVTNDERFAAGFPVFFQGEQVMSVVITTPTSGIYGAVDEVLFVQQIQTVVLLSAIVATVSVLIFYLSKWNRTLNMSVKEKTAELQRSNEQLTARTKELELANEQLIQHDKMQKEFINIAAHELRTPIQPLINIAEMLDNDFKETGKLELAHPEFEMLKRNATRLERLSSDILQVSRIESQNLKLDKETVNLKEKITNVVADARTYLQKGNRTRIVVEPFDGNLAVMADKAKLFEVLSNLIKNAIKFTQEGTITISVDVQRNDNVDYVSIRIKDTGTGIDHEVMPRLFTKFTSRSDQGTGLGLFISKSIVEAHGGRIWAENNQDGKGATFTFTLPLETQRTISHPEGTNR
jgi:signal transduction histidine kinase